MSYMADTAIPNFSLFVFSLINFYRLAFSVKFKSITSLVVGFNPSKLQLPLFSPLSSSVLFGDQNIIMLAVCFAWKSLATFFFYQIVHYERIDILWRSQYWGHLFNHAKVVIILVINKRLNFGFSFFLSFIPFRCNTVSTISLATHLLPASVCIAVNGRTDLTHIFWLLLWLPFVSP